MGWLSDIFESIFCCFLCEKGHDDVDYRRCDSQRAEPDFSREEEDYLTKAKQCLQAKQYCINLAKRQTNKSQRRKYHQMAKQNGESAIALMLKHFKEHPHDNKLDLHYFFVDEAVRLLREFLNLKLNMISSTANPREITVLVVTGRGLHSDDGVPKIKLAVTSILQKQNLRFSELRNNQGCLQVKLGPLNHKL